MRKNEVLLALLLLLLIATQACASKRYIVMKDCHAIQDKADLSACLPQ